MVQAATSRFLHVTWIEVGPSTFHVVARCELCNLVAERRVDDWRQDCALDVLGIESLATRGCTHVNDVVSSGVRRAFQR